MTKQWRALELYIYGVLGLCSVAFKILFAIRGYY
jgi:hypothetical protein